MKKLLFLIIGLLAFGNTWAAEETVAVKQVLTAKTLELIDGRIIRLAAIQAPNRARNEKESDQQLAQEAFARMQALAEGKSAIIKPVSKVLDRHGRIPAQVFVGGTSLQEDMLQAGLAWVYTFPDTRKLAKSFLAAEAEAEQVGRGVWSQSAYKVLDANAVGDHEGEFRLVQGYPTEIMIHGKGRSFINFGEDWKTDFTLIIAAKDLRRFDYAWLESLKGKNIRVRGWLFSQNGPAMELTHPEQIEVRR